MSEREFWIFKGTSCFADELKPSDDLDALVKHRSADGFYDLVSENDTIEGGIHVIEYSAYEKMKQERDELQAKLDVAVEALENCAKPGTYHMTGLCQYCQEKIQDWCNYKAKEALQRIEKIKHSNVHFSPWKSIDDFPETIKTVFVAYPNGNPIGKLQIANHDNRGLMVSDEHGLRPLPDVVRWWMDIPPLTPISQHHSCPTKEDE